MSVEKISTAILDEIFVYDSNDDPVLGLTGVNFTSLLTFNGAVSLVAITISEVGSGCYTVSFTPTANGTWVLLLRNATYNKRGWTELFQVTDSGVFTVNEAADGLLDRASAIDTFTPRQSLKLIAAVLCGKVSGAPSNPVFRSIDDSTNRVSATATIDGNRTSVTLSS